MKLLLRDAVVFLIFASLIFYFLKLKPANVSPAPEKDTAVPYGVYQTVPGQNSQTRIFALSASKNNFSFRKIIAFQNDIVRIHFTPQDKTYDISIPALSIKASARPGDVTPIEFQAVTSGTFTITCGNCPDPKPTAILLVQPKP